MMRHPYEDLPAFRRWSQSVAAAPAPSVDVAAHVPVKIARREKVATAGSCFAQHIARRLAAGGFNYFVTEPGHSIASEEIRQRFQYGLYSARYGNIYTARQLLQLFQEAFGHRINAEQAWEFDGRQIDPLRPAVEPNGFASMEEMLADRRQHLAAVRRMFLELDVFVFTLGLTEAFENTLTGTVYPLCPGVRGGTFDPSLHRFHNFDVFEIVEDLSGLATGLRAINPDARIILTVSPVPLIATAEDRHVLVSTTYSKSALRVAADHIQRAFPEFVTYFPSYEIVTGSFTRGRYFAEDLRSVTTEGVDHVMRTFFRHAVLDPPEDLPAAISAPVEASESFTDRMNEITRLICEEELLQQAGGT